MIALSRASCRVVCRAAAFLLTAFLIAFCVTKSHAQGLAAPTAVTAQAGNGQVVVDWAPVTGASGYTIAYHSGSNSDSTASASTRPHTISGLTNGTTYSFKVEASNSGSSYSGYVSATPNSPANLLAAPSPLVVRAVSGTEIDLAWSAVSGATNYVVYRGTSSSTIPILQYTGSTTTSFHDSSLPNTTSGITYYYQVAAVSANGVGQQTSVKSGVLGTTKLPAPQDILLQGQSTSEQIQWLAVSGATGYYIYRTTAGAAITSSTPPYDVSTSNAYVDSSVSTAPANNPYTYAVSAYNGNGEGYLSSSYSVTIGATGISAPTSVTATPGNSSVTLSWTPPASAPSGTNYCVYRDVTTSPTILVADGISGTTWQDTGLTNGTTYYYRVAAVNSGVRGTPSSTVSATPGNAAPTVASAASASPNPVTGTTTSLSVLGADDLGESNLTYTWSASGPASVSFSVNGTNAAKSSVATFTQAGSYSFTCTITDSQGASVTSSVSVTVSQTSTSLSVTPPSSSVIAGATKQLTASVLDQFGSALSSQPAVTWSVLSGGEGGTVSSTGLYTSSGASGWDTVQAVAGTFTATARVGTALAPPTNTPAITATGGNNEVTIASPGNPLGNPVIDGMYVYRGTSPGGESSTPISLTGSEDTNVVNGTTYYYEAAYYNAAGVGPLSSEVSATPIDIPTVATAASANPNPVYGSGTATTSVSVLGADSPNTSSLTYTWSCSTPSTVSFSPNGTNAAQNSTATFTAPGSYRLLVTITNTIGQSVTSSVVVSVNVPTVATAATASPNPVTGTTTSVAALGADGSLTSSLTYTWSSRGPASVSFSPNGTNAAQNSTATFTAVGNYNLTCTIADTNGASVTSAVSVTVAATPTAIVVSPATASLNTGATQQFSAAVNDQFGNALTTQPSLTWSALNGSVDSTGNYTAPASAGSDTVTATASGVSGTASVTVGQSAPSAPRSPSAVAGDQQVILSWLVPLAGPVTSYDIYRGTATGGESTSPVATGIAALTYTDTGLTDGTTYFYKISAVNSGGEGPQSPEVSATPTGSGLTITMPASASPNPVTSTTTSLSILGADGAGESSLTYTWSATGPASVTFSPNGTNAAKNSTATFTKAGTYIFTCTVADGQGNSAVSTVTVVVNQTLVFIYISPTGDTLQTNATIQFTATAYDQFTEPLSPQPTMAWSVISGGGSVSSSGLYTAPSAATVATVRASNGSIYKDAGAYVDVQDLQLFQMDGQLGQPNIFWDGQNLTMNSAQGYFFVNSRPYDPQHSTIKTYLNVSYSFTAQPEIGQTYDTNVLHTSSPPYLPDIYSTPLGGGSFTITDNDTSIVLLSGTYSSSTMLVQAGLMCEDESGLTLSYTGGTELPSGMASGGFFYMASNLCTTLSFSTVGGSLQVNPFTATDEFTFYGFKSTTSQTPYVQSISMNPDTVVGGNASTGTVTISAAAPSGGIAISLGSLSPNVIVPQTVTVPAGQTTVTFTANTVPVALSQRVVITATYNQISVLGLLNVTAPSLVSVALAPASVAGGQTSTGIVTISSAAPTTGLDVGLSSSLTGVTVPPSVHVAPGATTATFTVTTVAVSATTSATITGTLGGASQTATLTIQQLGVVITSPANRSTFTAGSNIPITAVVNNPNVSVTSVQFTDGTTTIGTATYNAATSTYNYAWNSVAAGQYLINAIATTSNNQTITSAPVLVEVTPPCAPAALSALSLSNYDINGAGTIVGTVTLVSAAITGGQQITLTSAMPNVASVPYYVSVPAGATTATFSIIVAPQTTLQTFNITASFHGTSESQQLKVEVVSSSSGTTSGSGNDSNDGGLTLTAQGIQEGYHMTTFATGFPTANLLSGTYVPQSDIAGPIGMAFNNEGQLLVTDPYYNDVYLFPSAADGQDASKANQETSSIKSVAYHDPAATSAEPFGLARLGTTIYVAAVDGGLATLNNDGTFNKQIPFGPLMTIAAGIVADPFTGSFFLDDDTQVIYKVDPSSAVSAFFGEGLNPDGLALSPDGKKLYIANYSGGFIYAFPTDPTDGGLSYAVTQNMQLVDGIGFGSGMLSGKLFANCGTGNVYEVDLTNTNYNANAKLIASGGTRGDFVTVAPDGSLLLTQSDSIKRLTPPPGGSFGSMEREVITRDENPVSVGTALSHAYVPIVMTDTDASQIAESAQTATYDTTDVTGQVVGAYLDREGQVLHSLGGIYDIQYGLSSVASGSNGLNAFGYVNESLQDSSVPADYDSLFALPSSFYPEMSAALNSNGSDAPSEYTTVMTDQVSSVCGSYAIADTPQQDWPSQKNILTYLIAPSGDVPRIDAGRCLDLTIPGTDTPAAGYAWEIDGPNPDVSGTSPIMLANSITPNGWSVEQDQTPYDGVWITVPITATVSSSISYEVKYSGNYIGSTTFFVDTNGTSNKVAVMLPMTGASGQPLTAQILGGGSAACTVSLDAPAPAGGATVRLTSSDPSVLEVPASVVIPAGATSAQFVFTTSTVTTEEQPTFVAEYNGYRVAHLDIVNTITGAGPPMPPRLKAVAGNSLVDLTWNVVSGAAGYVISRSTSPGGPFVPIYKTVGSGSNSYVDSGRAPGTTYYYMVQAFDNSGTSNDSNQVSATPFTVTVTTPTITPNGGSFSQPVTVTMACAMTGAVIYYQVNGGNWEEYTGPFVQRSTATLRAYAVLLSDQPSAIATASFTLSYTPPTSLPIICGQVYTNVTLSSTVSPYRSPGTYYADDYTFNAAAGEQMLFDAQGIAPTQMGTPLDTYIYLIDPDGNIVAQDGDDLLPGESQVYYNASMAGDYTVEVTTVTAGDTGQYTLQALCPNSTSSGLQLTNLVFSPDPVQGGAASQGTVTISGPAPTEGAIISLSADSSSSATFPETVTIPSGKTSATFEVDTSVVSSTANVPITASYNGSTATTSLIVSGVSLYSLALSSGSVIGGTSVTGTVTLTSAATADTTVSLASDYTAAASVPASVTIPSGSSSATFTVNTSGVQVSATANISAQLGSDSVSVPLTVLSSISITDLSFTPNPVVGGNVVQGTVTLSAPAPAGGAIVSLGNGTSTVTSAPSSVTVAAGQTSATFNIATAVVTSATNVPITAVFNGTSVTSTLLVTNVYLQTLSLYSNPIVGGTSLTATVTLSGSAPAGGVSIPITSSDTTTVPYKSVFVPGGQSQASVVLTTSTVTSATTVNIAATLGGTATVPLTVIPAASASVYLQSLSLDPAAVAGRLSSTGTVTLTGPATVDTTVALSSDSSVASVPTGGSVVVAAGQSSATFSVTTSPVSTASTANITASLDGATASVALTVLSSLELTGLSFTPNPVAYGGACQGMVTLSAAAPTGGVVVNLSSDSSGTIGLPASVTVAGGATTATFTVSTNQVQSSTTIAVTASYNGSTETSDLIVTGIYVKTLSISPSVVQSGAAAVGTVTLSGAPSSNTIVSLSSDNTSVATVPMGGVTVTAGTTTATFNIGTVSRLSAAGIANISATLGGTATAPLTVTPADTSGVYLKSLSIDPDPIVGGAMATGTVVLTAPAAVATTVTLTNDNSSAASIPSSISVPQGSSSKTFSVMTTATSSNTTANIQAALNGATAAVALSILSTVHVTALSFNPNPVVGGAQTTGTVTISASAPTGGIVVSLASSATSSATVPASVTVAAGQTTATFTVTTYSSANSTVTITAGYNGASVAGSLLVTSPTAAVPVIVGTDSNGHTVSSGGGFVGPLSVSISCATAGAEIYYTLDGSTPTTSSSVYSNPIVITATTTITAMATATGYANSGATSAVFVSGSSLGVAITSPSNGSELSANTPFTITASAQDSVASIASVQFYINGSAITNGTVKAAPYTVAVSGLSPGSYALTAVATDTNNVQVTSQTVNITVGASGGVSSAPITCGQTISGTLEASDGTSALIGQADHYADHYTLTGNSGDAISVTATSTDFNPDIFLTDASGNVITGAGSSGGSSATLNAVLPATGTYIIEVTSEQSLVTGAYTVNLACSGTAQSQLQLSVGGNIVANAGIVDFGLTSVNTPVIKTFTVTNTGNAALNLGTLNLLQTAPGFHILSGLSSPLQPGQACSFNVELTGTSGEATGTLQVTNDSSVNPFAVTLIGRAGAPIGVSSVALSSSGVVGGVSLTGTVTISENAPPGGIVVTLQSGNTGVVTVPANVTVAQGVSTAHFNITTNAVKAITDVPIVASLGSSQQAATLRLAASTDVPVVSLAAPTNTAPFVEPIDINLVATATAAAGSGRTIKKVQFYSSVGSVDTLIGQVGGPNSTNNYNFTWYQVLHGSYNVFARATDSAGLTSDSDNINFTVNAGTVTPNPTITSDGPVVTIADSDPNAVIYYSINLATANQKNGTIYSQPFVVGTQSGSYVVWAIAYSTGNIASAPETATITLSNGTTGLPTAHIIAPSDGTALNSPTSVTGTVRANTGSLVSWELDYAPEDGSSPPNWTEFGSGASPVSGGNLALLDTTLMLNGLYSVRLTVVDSSGNISTDQVTVVVQGGEKVGYFTMSFADMTVPIAGLPITVTRTYDSREKASQGDFGNGWTLSTSNVKIEMSDPIGNDWQSVSAGIVGFVAEETVPHIITVTLPGNVSYSFRVTPSTGATDGTASGTLSFAPLTGTHATLTATVSMLYMCQGTHLVDLDLNVLKCTDFILTLADGRALNISTTAGLKSITDLAGNTTTFSPGAITTTTASGASRSITITRGSNNVITSITDPAGQSIEYAPDNNGNLATVTDRVGNVSTFSYDLTHLLTGVIDPSGVQPITNHYDSTGRLTSTSDASANSIYYTYPAANTETIEDRLGNITTLTYDSWGNVTQKQQILVEPSPTANITITTSSTYDDSGPTPSKPLTTTDALGRVTSYTYDALGNLLTSARSHVISSTDSVDATTTSTYNSYSQLLTSTDALGHVTATNVYDAYGNLSSTTDSLGNVTSYSYNPDGTVASTMDAKKNVTSYGYDTAGDVTSVTDASHHTVKFFYDVMGNKTSQSTTRTNSLTGQTETLTTQFQYDQEGRLVATIAPDGSTSQTVYNPIGKVDHTVDAGGRITSYTYTDQGQLASTTYPDGTSTRVTYDANGNPLDSYDRASRRTHTLYDSLGRVTETDEYGTGSSILSSTETTYDYDGETTAETDANGNITSYGYDDLGRKVTTQDAVGNMVETTAYDLDDRELSTTDANNHTTSYDYDADGRLLTTTYDDNTTISTVYDELGRKISTTDQDNLTTGFGYDALGRLTTVTSPMSHVETYTYDELGEKVTQTDANKHTTSFAYDQKGHVIQKTLPAAQTMSSSYNPDGTLASTTDYNGQTVAMEYDSAGRLIAKHDGTLTGTVLASFVYSTADGSLTSKSKGNVTTSYAYDSLGRTSSVTTSNSGSGGISSAVSYTYDAASNKKTQATSSATLTYDYDADERLTAVHSASALDETSATIIATYSYDPAGNRKSLVRSNGVATSYQYDDLNRLTQITNEQQGSTTPISSYQYDLSPSGKRLSVTDQSKAVTGYAYDDDGRLIEEKSAAAGDAVYGYDAVGNRLSKSVSGTVTQSLHYDADDRVIGYGYDANGNVLNDGVRSYAWDWENKLINSGVAGSALYSRTYVYDANGLRVQQAVKSNVTNYVVDADSGFGNVVEERDGSDNLLLRYDYGDDLVRMDRTDGEYYYLYDGLGSTRQLTDSSGGAITGDSYNYDAFGNLSTVSTSSTEMLFDGQEQDGSGLYYLRARYMDPTRGEFLGQDPFEGRSNNPSTLHKYLYAGDDPVQNEDPSGKDFDLSGVLTATGIATGLISLTAVAYAVGNHASLEITEGMAWSHLFPNISTSLRDVVAKIPMMWNLPSNKQYQARARAVLTNPSDAWDAWDIEELTNHNQYGPEESVGNDSIPYVTPEQTDLHMVRVDGQTFHDYSVNFVAYGAMMQISGHSRDEVITAVNVDKFVNEFLDQSAAMAWALAGYDGWPDGVNTPESDIISAGDSGITTGLAPLSVRWDPFGLY